VEKSLTEIISEMPLVWADHIVAAYVHGLKDMLKAEPENHRNLMFDVYKDQAQAIAQGRRYQFKEDVDF